MLKLGPEQDLAHTDCIIILNTCVPLKYLAEKMIYALVTNQPILHSGTDKTTLEETKPKTTMTPNYIDPTHFNPGHQLSIHTIKMHQLQNYCTLAK